MMVDPNMFMDTGPAESTPAAFPFPATLWSRVLRTRAEATDARAALDDLCRVYWPPVVGYLRALGCGFDEAEDVAQDFFATFLRRQGFQRAEQGLGTLRSYLKGAIRHHLLHWRRDQSTQKRGGNLTPIALDAADAPDLPAPEDAASLRYDEHWAVTVMQRALLALREGYEQRGRLPLYDKLLPLLFQSEYGDTAALASALGMTRGALAVEQHRARKKLADLLRSEVMQTVEDAAETEAELMHLLRVLARTEGAPL